MSDLERSRWKLLVGDVRSRLADIADSSVQCVVTSPPYWGLRDYGFDNQLGLESTIEEFVENLVDVFRNVRRVLRDDGTLWLNLGDSYSVGTYSSTSYRRDRARCNLVRPSVATGLKPKDLCGIPWRVAFALQSDGWWLRSAITWCKKSPMPESCRDRPTTATEMIFLLTKNSSYFYDQDVERIKQVTIPHAGGGKKGNDVAMDRGGNGWLDEKNQSKVHDYHPGGRNLWNYWTDLTGGGYAEAHFAVFPESLPTRCIKLGTSERGCCKECHAPWERVVERDRKPTRPARDNVRDETGMANRDYERHVTETWTTGWKPGCDCGISETVPCVVLDCFAGSGTTLKVAVELGRYGLGIELNPDYAKLAEYRLNLRESPIKQHPSLPGQQTLFG